MNSGLYQCAGLTPLKPGEMKSEPQTTCRAAAQFNTALLLFVNLAVGLCLAFFFWLAGVWMIDDSMAARFTAADWRGVAFERAATGLFVALVVGAVFGFINRLALARLFPENTRPHWLIAGFAGWLIVAGTIAGSIQFLIEKPYM